MHYYIYCNQKNISLNHQQAIHEFTKRLSSYCDIQLIITPQLAMKEPLSEQNHQFLILTKGPSTYSSEEFSKTINTIQLSGKSNLHIFIGFDMSDIYEAFSNTPQLLPPTEFSLTRSSLRSETLTVLFYEQLYRAYTILQGKTYHK